MSYATLSRSVDGALVEPTQLELDGDDGTSKGVCAEQLDEFAEKVEELEAATQRRCSRNVAASTLGVIILLGIVGCILATMFFQEHSQVEGSHVVNFNTGHDACNAFRGIMAPEGNACCKRECGEHCGVADCWKSSKTECCTSRMKSTCSHTQDAPCKLLCSREIQGVFGAVVTNSKRFLLGKSSIEACMTGLAQSLNISKAQVTITGMSERAQMSEVLVGYRVVVAPGSDLTTDAIQGASSVIEDVLNREIDDNTVKTIDVLLPLVIHHCGKDNRNFFSGYGASKTSPAKTSPASTTHRESSKKSKKNRHANDARQESDHSSEKDSTTRRSTATTSTTTTRSRSKHRAHTRKSQD